MEIYAEINKKTLAKLESGFCFAIPAGVTMSRRKNSRGCLFECSDDYALSELRDLLDLSGISWQEND